MSSLRLVVVPLVLLSACSDSGGASSGATAGVTEAATTAQDSTGASAGNTTPGTGTSEPTGGSISASESGSTGATQGTTGALTTTLTGGGTTDEPATTTGTTDPGTTTTGGSTTGGSTDGTTGGSTTDGSTSDTSGTGSGTTGEPVVEGLWLTTLEDVSSPTRLYKIDLETGAGTLLCQLDTTNDYNTSTFGRDGLLYAANAHTKDLEVINPCDCKRTVLGPTNIVALPGITADQALGLYGMDTNLDNFIALDPQTGKGTVIGPFGFDWGTGGLTWSDEIQDTYALNGSDDKLYTINHQTGKPTALVQTNYNFGSVGIEWHPKTAEIYACSNPAQLLKVNPKTGEVTVVGSMNFQNQAHCDNLAAPWVPVPCVENK